MTRTPATRTLAKQGQPLAANLGAFDGLKGPGGTRVRGWRVRRICAAGCPVARHRVRSALSHWRSETGVALLVVLVCLTLCLSAAAVLVIVVTMEARMAGAARARYAVRGAAEVALERALQELAVAADWTAILGGGVRSGFVEGAGVPRVGDWGVLDLAALTRRLQQDADAANQWGPDGPVWRLFGFGSLDGLLAAAGGAAPGAAGPGAAGGGSAPYTVIWVADDAGEGDGNPSADANGCVTVRAEAFGPFRSRQALVAMVRRRGAGLELLDWREPGEG